MTAEAMTIDKVVEAMTVDKVVEAMTVDKVVEAMTGDHPRTTIVVEAAKMTETAEISPKGQVRGRAHRSRRMVILP